MDKFVFQPELLMPDMRPESVAQRFLEADRELQVQSLRMLEDEDGTPFEAYADLEDIKGRA